MGKKDEQRKKFNFYDEGENSGGDGSRRSKNDNSPMSSDDEEANEDLSLKIVEKARLMRAAKFVPDKSGEYDLVLRESRDCAGDAVGGAVDLSSSSVRQSEAGGEGPSGSKGGKVVVASVEEDLGKKKIRKVKKKLKIKKVEAEENVDIVEEERSEKVEDLALSAEPKDVGMTDKIVCRKLLRGPRYFDPPGSSWDACFNCGEEGHNAVNCTAPKWKKPCFVCGSLDHNVDIVKEERSEKVEDLALSAEPKDVGMTNNIVFRKLLRGPRYFDPPGSSLDACFNCGEEGHNAVNCTAPKRKKPCFVCGSLDHNAKSCSKAQNCFICKKDGHRAKNCSEGSNAKSKMCLKCGDSGHDMFFCQNDYSLDDLKNIQCYICKNFGHLCCISPTNATQEVSCYKCGQSGHTGLACARLRQEVTGTGTPSSCYKCGEEGHFARECLSSSKASARLSQEVTGMATPSSCFKCGEESHFARECPNSTKASARLSQEVAGMATPSSCFKCGEESHFARECPNSTKVSKRNFESTTPTLRFHRNEKDLSGCKVGPNNLHKGSRKKKPKYEQIDAKTPQKSRCRGGWIVDDPGDFSPSRSKFKHWGNPVTPPSRMQMAPFSYTDNYTRFRPSPNMHNVHSGYPMSQGSNYGFQPRFSSSRFGNSGGGSGGMWRNHNW